MHSPGRNCTSPQIGDNRTFDKKTSKQPALYTLSRVALRTRDVNIVLKLK